MENMKLKVFISVPMRNRNEAEIEGEILLTRQAFMKKMQKENCTRGITYQFVDNYHRKHDIDPKVLDHRMLYVGDAIKLLADCNIAVFGKGWDKANGCKLEAMACELYNIPRVMPKEEDEGFVRYY